MMKLGRTRTVVGLAGLTSVAAVVMWALTATGAPPGPTFHIVYPLGSDLIEATDSLFLYGAVDPATTSVFVEDEAVRVHASGTFLARVETPFARGGISLRGIAGNDTTTLVHPVRLQHYPPGRVPEE